MANRQRNQQLLYQFLLDKKCKDCGIVDIRILTFDHLPKYKKTATISELVNKGVSWERVLKEIAKCDIVCHNDHVIREETRKNSLRNQIYNEQQR